MLKNRTTEIQFLAQAGGSRSKPRRLSRFISANTSLRVQGADEMTHFPKGFNCHFHLAAATAQ